MASYQLPYIYGFTDQKACYIATLCQECFTTVQKVQTLLGTFGTAQEDFDSDQNVVTC